MNIFCVNEYELNSQHKKEIAELLDVAFDGYPSGQTYYRQLPSFRFIGEDGNQLVLHSSIDHRMIQIGDQKYEVWGLVDFCVHPKYQKMGWGKKFMKKVLGMAKKNDIAFLILTSDQSNFYEKVGFESKTVRARWLAIHQQGTFGIHERRLKNSLYVLPLKKNKWPEGTVDFLGTMI